MPLFLIFIIFNNHLHSKIIHSFILHHSPRPVFLYPLRFFAQQEKNLPGVPYSKPTHYQLSHAALCWATPHPTEPRRPCWATPHPTEPRRTLIINPSLKFKAPSYNFCPIQFVPQYNLCPIQFVPDTICAPIQFVTRYNLCPIQYVLDTVCSWYNLFPIHFVPI